MLPVDEQYAYLTFELIKALESPVVVHVLVCGGHRFSFCIFLSLEQSQDHMKILPDLTRFLVTSSSATPSWTSTQNFETPCGGTQHKKAPDSPPMNDIQKLALRTADTIKSSFQQLHTIVDRHEAEIRRRWTKMSPSKRRRTLAAAWPGIPDSHRPASFGSNGPDLKRPANDTLSNEWGSPFINQEDLQDPKALFMLINARGRHPPDAFAMTKVNFLLQSQLTSLPQISETPWTSVAGTITGRSYVSNRKKRQSISKDDPWVCVR